jgi:hypothetical protein
MRMKEGRGSRTRNMLIGDSTCVPLEVLLRRSGERHELLDRE